jgi:hypothetical protein
MGTALAVLQICPISLRVLATDGSVVLRDEDLLYDFRWRLSISANVIASGTQNRLTELNGGFDKRDIDRSP